MSSKLFVALAAAFFAWSGVAGAQEKFPSRPIETIVNFGPGGGADQLGRIASQVLERILKVPLPVSNIVGASGNTGLAKVASAQPDGYTIGVITGLSISSWATGMGRLGVNDFAYLGVVQSSPSMLFVVIDSPIKNYRQLLDAAKASPGKLKVATAGFGTLDDFAVKFLAKKGFPMINAPYAKPAERYTSILGKHTDVLFEEPGDVAQFLTAKQMRPIVVFGNKRHPEFADVPASAEFDQHIDLPNWRALVVSPKVPKDRIEALNAALVKMTDTAEWKKFCAETYTCIAAMNPVESKKFVQKNFDDAVAFLKETGTQANK
jgi:tripartite-type tricarboxylate transporter receptor subunit TctC